MKQGADHNQRHKMTMLSQHADLPCAAIPESVFCNSGDNIGGKWLFEVIKRDAATLTTRRSIRIAKHALSVSVSAISLNYPVNDYSTNEALMYSTSIAYIMAVGSAFVLLVTEIISSIRLRRWGWLIGLMLSTIAGFGILSGIVGFIYGLNEPKGRRL